MNKIVIDGQSYKFDIPLEKLLTEDIKDPIINPCYVPGNFPWQK